MAAMGKRRWNMGHRGIHAARLSAFALFVLFSIRSSLAATFLSGHPASVCEPANATTATFLDTDAYGVSNRDAEKRNVVCPIWQTKTPSPNMKRTVFVRVYDRNPTQSFSCTVTLRYWNGSNYASTSLTQQTAGGFASNSATTLSFFFPTFSPALVWGSATCGIPGVDSVNGKSLVVGIQYNAINP
jgi:hypothetical protein